MNTVPDKYAQWDAAYVLGALSPEDRREFEEHLAGCATCQQAVSEVAGIPGLLAQVAPEDAAVWSAAPDPDTEDAVPETLLPNMITHIRTRQRRVLTVLAGVAAAIVLLAGGVAIGARVLPLGNQPQRLAFSSVAPSSITAVVEMVPVEKGTQVQVECQYGEVNEARHGDAYAEYSIVIVDRSDQSSEIKEWYAKPNKQMRPQAITPLKISEIKRVEIRKTDTGETLLQASLR